jgi:hypothetical protein
MGVIDLGIERMGVEIAEVFPREFDQRRCQSSRSSAKFHGKSVGLPFMPA